MFKSITKFIQENLHKNNEEVDDQQVMHLASAALLLEVSRADFDIQEEELEAIANSFSKRFNFSKQEAKNLILSEFSRKTKKVTDYIEDYSDEESLFNGDELESEMIALQKLGIYCEALVALPTQCRRVIIMKKVYGMKNKDIAIRLDISISTVEKHLSKGIRQSASMLASRYESSKTDNNQTEDNVKEMK